MPSCESAEREATSCNAETSKDPSKAAGIGRFRNNQVHASRRVVNTRSILLTERFDRFLEPKILEEEGSLALARWVQGSPRRIASLTDNISPDSGGGKVPEDKSDEAVNYGLGKRGEAQEHL